MATTAQIEQTTATSIETAQEQRYKYIVLGETLYLTREEIKARFRRIEEYRNRHDSFLDELVDDRIKNLLKYNGDPYGHYKGDVHRIFHELDAEGKTLIIY